jgi:hypothetical protein
MRCSLRVADRLYGPWHRLLDCRRPHDGAGLLAPNRRLLLLGARSDCCPLHSDSKRGSDLVRRSRKQSGCAVRRWILRNQQRSHSCVRRMSRCAHLEPAAGVRSQCDHSPLAPQIYRLSLAVEVLTGSKMTYYISMIAACVSQTGCVSHDLACCAEPYETKKFCVTAAQGYFVDTATHLGVAFACNDMSTVSSVASCQVCASVDANSCALGTCEDGFHTYASNSPADPSCTPCTEVDNAENDATYTCSTALDSRVSGCDTGYTREPGSFGTTDVCSPNPCPASTTATWLHEGYTNQIAPGVDMASGTTTTVECEGWHAGYRGLITLSCFTGIVSVPSHECTHYDPCAEETDDCAGDGHICEATGPGLHSCSCPANSYGTATPELSGGTSCTPCTANSGTASGVPNVLVSSCICHEGYATNSNAAHALALPTSRSIASADDRCTAVFCPVNSAGYTDLWSGAPDACRCNAGYFGPPVWDSTINGYSVGCTLCTPVANAVSVTCAEADNSRATCDTGFYLTANSGASDTCTRAFFRPSHTTPLFLTEGVHFLVVPLVPDVVLNRCGMFCTVCEQQTNCISHAVACSAIAGHTTEKSCFSAALGSFVAGDVVMPCTPVANAVSITCASAANSRAVCNVGFFITRHSVSSDTCSGA